MEKLLDDLIVYRVYEQDIAQAYGVGTWYKGVKINAFYDELESVLGEPTYITPNEDQSVYRSWVCRWNSDTYEIYDYNTYSEDYTLNYLRLWNVGGSDGSDAHEFAQMIEQAIKENKNGIN